MENLETINLPNFVEIFRENKNKDFINKKGNLENRKILK
jgi:hypothetical protein